MCRHREMPRQEFLLGRVSLRQAFVKLLPLKWPGSSLHPNHATTYAAHCVMDALTLPPQKWRWQILGIKESFFGHFARLWSQRPTNGLGCEQDLMIAAIFPFRQIVNANKPSQLHLKPRLLLGLSNGSLDYRLTGFDSATWQSPSFHIGPFCEQYLPAADDGNTCCKVNNHDFTPHIVPTAIPLSRLHFPEPARSTPSSISSW